MSIVCPVSQLIPNRGVAALVGGQAIAVFWLGGDRVHAIGNHDPFSGAGVLSRGLVGDAAGGPTVASPMYKQRFDLLTGACLDDPAVSVPVHRATVVAGVVHVELSRP